jgi:hypothetical protein
MVPQLYETGARPSSPCGDRKPAQGGPGPVSAREYDAHSGI